MRHKGVDTGPRFNRRSTDRPKEYESSMDLILAAVIAMLVILMAGWFA